jgi:hypothetical protein
MSGECFYCGAQGGECYCYKTRPSGAHEPKTEGPHSVSARQSGFTPGPWGMQPYDDAFPETGGFEIAPIDAEGQCDWSREVCLTASGNKLDALLICAAPDLLEAAKEATISRGCNDPDCCEAAITHEAALDKLCRAIAKAEGR